MRHKSIRGETTLYTFKRVLGSLVVAVYALLFFAFPVQAADEFCWKDSYGRGVGTIPTQCSGGQDQRGRPLL